MVAVQNTLHSFLLCWLFSPLFGQTLGPPPAPPAMVGGLQVIVNVPGAKVFVDGQPKGELTPPQVLNLADLPIGSLQVRVEAPGYQTRALNFTIQPGTWTQAVFVLVKQGRVTVPLPPKGAQPGLNAPAKSDPSALPGTAQNAQGLLELTLQAGPVALAVVQIPAGRFRMGSAAGDGNELPIHDVTLGKAFWMGKYPVTQQQWQALMGYNPSKFKAAGPEAPVENVSWNAAQSFLNHLNEKQTDWTFRLPSEAEWEYACKAGSTGMRSGDSLKDIAWYKDNSGGTTHPVGQKRPNAWGLHDMLGNVWQWCEDLQHENYEGAPNDGNPWVTGSVFFECGIPYGMSHGLFRAMPMTRGGSWNSEGQDLRSTNREKMLGSNANKDQGFRIVCTPK